MKKVILAIGTGLGAGYFPFFPGTVGSLWGVLIYLLLRLFTINIWWHLSVAIGVLLLGVWVFQAEDGIRDSVASRGLGDVYKRQFCNWEDL